jgi:hypothetical protein
MMRVTILILQLSLISVAVCGQIEDRDESRLYAQTKQVNQFFRRFNGQEDEKGERYDTGDKQYQSVKLRKKYLGILFDASNAGIGNELKTQFAKDVLDRSSPIVLDFHGPEWYCEVQTIFTQNGREYPVTLFMELERARVGSKWVIRGVHADLFNRYFKRDTIRVGQFLHPLSHELEFMNLRKAFLNRDSVNQYVAKDHVPDQLTLFLYEIQKGNLQFKTVTDVKFHFFQISGWYFELAQFNRPGYNTGWLISNLVKLTSESDKKVLKKYVFYESR